MRKKIKIKRKILLEPTKNEWESAAVLNPGAIKKGDTLHLIYRAVRSPNYSSLGYAQIVGNKITRYSCPLLEPSGPYEKGGIEDPRITRLEGEYYILYTAWDGVNVRVALAESKDFKKVSKKGIISPNIPLSEAIQLVPEKRYKENWRLLLEYYGQNVVVRDKDACLFPEKINGRYAMLHRLRPDIQIVYFDEFSELQEDEFWRKYLREIQDKVVMQPKYKWEEETIGAGPPPIKTDKGWLLIYHGVDKNKIYRVGAALLDFNNPQKIISRLKEPLFGPGHPWEKYDHIHNVVFPTGAIIEEDRLEIFYGCVDTKIGLASLSLKKLLDKLIK